MRTRQVGIWVTLVFWVLVSGCASFTPRSLADVGFEQRAQSKTEGGVQVSVVALTKVESGRWEPVPR